MNRSEFTKAVLSGAALLLVEYRSTIAINRNYKDKIDGKIKSFPICEHNCEVGGVSWPIGERLPDGADVTKIVPQFKKGQTLVWRVESMGVDAKGNRRAAGALEPLTD